MTDKAKIDILKKYGTVEVIYGCQWTKQRSTVVGHHGAWENGARSHYSSLFYQSNISEADILERIYNNDAFGIG